MVSQERIAREQAQEEMHWQRATLNSIERQLERTLEAGDAAEDEYWALRRQRSFGTMLGQPEPGHQRRGAQRHRTQVQRHRPA